MDVSAADLMSLSPSPLPPFMAFPSLIQVSLIEEEIHCEQCKLGRASIECRGCLMDGEPFYYCQACSDMIHLGNRKCSHPLSQLINVDELKRKMEATLSVVEESNQADHKSLKKTEELRTDLVARSENLTAECKYLFGDLRKLLDSKEEELISYFETKRAVGLEIAQTEEETCQSRIKESDHMIDELKELIESPFDEFKDKVLTLLPKVDDMEQLVNESCVSLIPKLMALIHQMSFLPDTNNIKNSIMGYCVPYHHDWSEGDTVMVVAPVLNIDTHGHFWLHEPLTPLVMGHLTLISQTLTNMINSMRVRSSSDSQFSPGDICAAFYPQDSLWHRACIEKVFSSEKRPKVAVRYIDYGNSQELHPDFIMTLPSRLKEYPYQCRRCKFNDDSATDWRACREAKWKYSDLVSDNNLTAIILNKSVLPDSELPLFTVQLFNDDIDIGDTVLQVARDMFNRKKEPYPMISKDIRYLNDDSKAPPTNHTHTYTLPPSDLHVSKASLKLDDKSGSGSLAKEGMVNDEVEQGGLMGLALLEQEGVASQEGVVSNNDPVISEDTEAAVDAISSEGEKSMELTSLDDQEQYYTPDDPNTDPNTDLNTDPGDLNSDPNTNLNTDANTDLNIDSSLTGDATHGETDHIILERVSTDSSRDDIDTCRSTLLTVTPTVIPSSTASLIDSQCSPPEITDTTITDTNADTNTDSTDLKVDTNTDSFDLKPDTNAESADLKPDTNTESADLKLDTNTESADLKLDTNTESADLKLDTNTESADLKLDTNTESADLKPDTNTESDLKLDTNTESADLKLDTKTESADLKPDTNIKSADLKPDTSSKPAHLELDTNIESVDLKPDTNTEPTDLVNTGHTKGDIISTTVLPTDSCGVTEPAVATNDEPAGDVSAKDAALSTDPPLAVSHDPSSLSSSPFDSTQKPDTASVSHILASDADQESDDDNEKRQRVKRSFSHRMNTNFTTDSDTTVEDNDSAPLTPPVKATPLAKSLPKLTLDLDSQVSADEVANNLDTPVYHPLIVEGAKLSVSVNSSLDSSGCFWSQLCLDDVDGEVYTKLFDKLQEHASSKGQYTPVFFSPGDLCLAVFSEDDQWYRGRVESVGKESTLNIRFMDYGNTESVPVTSMMALKSDFRQLPFQAFCCFLGNEEKSTFSDEELKCFDDVIQLAESITATVVSVSDSVVSVSVVVNQEGEERDLLRLISNPIAKSRTYSFELTPEEENVEGLTWADRTDRDLLAHSDSDVFLKSKAAGVGGAGNRACAGTDIDDPWMSETDIAPLPSLNKRNPLPKRKDSFEKRSRSGKKDSSKVSSFGTSASSTSADSANSSKTGPAGKREAKTRGMINPSSIVKYLGQDEKKVLIAKKEPEDSEKRRVLGLPLHENSKSDSSVNATPTRNRTFSGSTSDSASTGRHTPSWSASEFSLGERGTRGGGGRGGRRGGGRGGAQRGPGIISLFVAGIPNSYTIKDVINGFAEFGHVYDVRKAANKHKPGAKVFFVDMMKEDAIKAKDNLQGFKVPSAKTGLIIKFDHQSSRPI